MALADLNVNVGIEGDRKIIAALREMGVELKHAAREAIVSGDLISHALDSVVSVASNALHSVLSFGQSAVQSIFAAGVAASKAASDFEDMQTRLESITHSAQRAKEVLDFAKIVAGPSPFTLDDLAESATMLEAMGVNSQRVLPLVGKLGAAFGAGREQLEMFTRAIAELSQGKMIEADVKASMGLTNADFEARGVQFDGSGQMITGARVAMDALESIITERFGDIFEKTAGTFSAKTASMVDSLQNFSRAWGQVLNDHIAPAIDFTTRMLTAIQTTGVLSDVMDRFSRGLTGLFHFTPGKELTNALAAILSIVGNLPEFIRVAIYNTGQLFRNIAHNAQETFLFINELIKQVVDNSMGIVDTLGNILPAPFGPIIKGLEALVGSGALNKIKAPDFKDLTDGMQKSPEMLGQMAGYSKLIDGFMGKSQASKAITPTGDYWTNGGPSDPMQKVAENTAKIATNTGKTYDILSLRRQTVGGGELGSLGVTPAELFGGSGYSGGPFGGHYLGNTVQEVFNEMGRRMEDIVQNMMVRTVQTQSGGVGRFRPNY